jgi:hypothetical protein
MYIISAVASRFLGHVVDEVGKNVFWVCLSVLVSIGCHALLAFTFMYPYIAVVRTMSLLLLFPCEHRLRSKTGILECL